MKGKQNTPQKGAIPTMKGKQNTPQKGAIPTMKGKQKRETKGTLLRFVGPKGGSLSKATHLPPQD
jgi:hypothetical protein